MEYISTYFFAVTCSCIRSMHLILWTLINSQHQSHTITTSKFVLPVKFACLSFCLSVCLSVSRNKHKFQCSHMQLYKIDAFDPKDLKSLHQSHTNSSIKICVYCLWSLLSCLPACRSHMECIHYSRVIWVFMRYRRYRKLFHSISHTSYGNSLGNWSSSCIIPCKFKHQKVVLFPLLVCLHGSLLSVTVSELCSSCPYP